MNRSNKASGWVWAVIIVVVGLYVLGRHGSTDSPSKASNLISPPSAPSLVIVSQDQKDAGTYDGSFYNYVTVRNTGTNLIDYVGVDSTCTNDAGTVVGTGFGNEANVAPGEQTVVTVIFLNVDDCTHISSKFDSLTD